MQLTWEPTDADRELFQRELDSFVPDRIYDVHAHLYELWQWKKPTILEGGPEKLPLERYQEEIQWITPGRETHGLFFGGGLHEETFRASNEYVAAQVAKDPASRSLLIVSPHMDPEEVRQEVRRLSMVGLKVYQHFAPGEETWEAEIEEFLTEEHVRVAHEEELVIMLHMVKSRALADRSTRPPSGAIARPGPGCGWSWRTPAPPSTLTIRPKASTPWRVWRTSGSIPRP